MIEAQIRLEDKKLEAAAAAASKGSSGSSSKSGLNFPKGFELPQFSEEDPELFFLHFAKLATSLKWPEESWVTILQGQLRGKAQQIFASLPFEDSFHYPTVKKKILQAYELNAEALRQKFRGLKRTPDQTVMDFARMKESLFDRWVNCTNSHDFSALKQLILVEELFSCLPAKLNLVLATGKPAYKDVHELAMMADEHETVNKISCSNVNMAPKSFTSRLHELGKSRSSHQNGRSACTARADQTSIKSKGNVSLSSSRATTVVKECTYCHKKGHVVRQCFRLHPELRPTALVVSKKRPGHNSQIVSKGKPKWLADFDAYKVHAKMVGVVSKWIPVTMFRDTGASQTLITSKLLSKVKSINLDEIMLIQGIGGVVQSVPLVQVYIKSPYTPGICMVGVCDTLPIPEIDVLLGNDIAGTSINCHLPIMLSDPGQVISEESEIDPVVYPACAVTRSQVTKSPVDVSKPTTGGMAGKPPMLEQEVDLADTFMAHLEEVSADRKVAPSDKVVPSVTTSPPIINVESHTLAQLQKCDPSLHACFLQAVPEEDALADEVGYFLRDQKLMRRWRSRISPSSEDCESVTQLIVPKAYRNQVLSAAHDDPYSGHQGISRMLFEVTKFFYWPSIKKDIGHYCKQCITCQVVGKPNQVVPKAPLHPIVVPREPFSHILLDCVGPLSRTKSGHIYIISMMCATTRFVEAFPVKNIRAKTVIHHLTKFFTLFGLPRVIQSDNGGNFCSAVFRRFCLQYHINHQRSSTYHPQSQGALERFHQTMKQMLRTVGEDSGRNWDEDLPFVLFAARNGLQHSLGCSPFQLVFGHSVRGPVQLLQERMLGNVSLPEGSRLLSEMQTKMKRYRDVAWDNLQKSQSKMKLHHDKKYRVQSRCFRSGDLVLMLKTRKEAALGHSFDGPFEVIGRSSDLTYRVRSLQDPSIKHVVHINRLKKFQGTRPVSCVLQDTVTPGNHLPVVMSNTTFCPSSIEKMVEHLDERKQRELKHVLVQHGKMFGEVPSQTPVISHDIQLTDTTPIRLHPYRVSPEKREIIRREVEFLLEHGLVKPSTSSWCSPCLLVPKPDGEWRLCVDYRRLNKVTVVDTYPLPLLEDCIDQVGHCQYISKLDLSKGYHQVPLTSQASELSAFVTPDGCYQYTVMPFGLRNAPATFQRLMNLLLRDIPQCRAYLDDIVLYHDSWQSHLQGLKLLFAKLQEANLTVNPLKCNFARGTIVYLGHEVGQGRVMPLTDKINAIVNYPILTNKKQVQRFLGMTAYYRRYCKNFSVVASPLTDLLQQRKKFKWTTQCQVAFDGLKSILSSSPVLAGPVFNKPFIMYIDASDLGAGAVLLQVGSDNIEHPVYYYSRKFTSTERNYSVVEKEAYALVLACKKFEVYLQGNKVDVYTDHNPLIFIDRMKMHNQKILRWSLYLQEFNLHLHHIPGKLNVLADALSRCFPE